MAALREVAASLRPSVIIADTWGSSYKSLEPSERFEIAEVAQLAPLILITGQQWAANMTADELGVACILPELVNLEQLIDEIRRCLEESSEA